MCDWTGAPELVFEFSMRSCEGAPPPPPSLYIITILPHLTLRATFFLFLFPSPPPSLPQSQGSSSSGRTRSFSLLPHLNPSSSPGSQRHLSHTASPGNIVTITHHKSPAAARRSKNQYPGRLLEVKEVGVAASRAALSHLIKMH